MSKKTKLVFSLFLLAAIVVCIVFLIPRSYPVPEITIRSGTAYWKLKTGSRIAYTKLSPVRENGLPPIIYLHGGPGGPIYNHNIEQLKPLTDNGFSVYLYDQIGGGLSDRLDNIEEYTVERHREDLRVIIDKIGSGKVIFIAQSWGAMLATNFISYYPDKVDKLILTGPGPILPINYALKSIVAPDSLELKAPHYSNQDGNKKAHNLRTKLIKNWAHITGKKLASDQEADQFATYLNSFLNKSMYCDTSLSVNIEAGSGYYVQLATVKDFHSIPNRRDQLKKLKHPVLILKGQCDNQAWGYTEEYLKLFQNSELKIIPNAGHGLSTEQPELYLKYIRDFLKNA
jgi:proline iminopeptidase